MGGYTGAGGDHIKFYYITICHQEYPYGKAQYIYRRCEVRSRAQVKMLFSLLAIMLSLPKAKAGLLALSFPATICSLVGAGSPSGTAT